MYRILVPGGRLVCVVGDIWLSRKKFGRHSVIPFPSDICLACRDIGFENLNPIIWHKVSTAIDKSRERSRFLGKPYGPNGIIKNEIDYILMQRKPGGYRKATKQQRELSKIGKHLYNKWFQQFWNIQDDATRSPLERFPHEIADRLIRMFSFWGDTVIDPFSRTGTTLVAAMRCERNSIGIETDERYCRIALNRLHEASSPLFTKTLPDLMDLSVYNPPSAESEHE
jgi:site-specific DNA-methyltransferase (adenine-specific)